MSSMASQFLSNPMAYKLALQFYAIKKSLSNYGKTPVGKDDKGQTQVDGEDTDEAVLAASPNILYVITGVALIVAVITMYFYQALLLDFASLCLLVVSPVVAVQKVKLQRLGDLRGQHNAIRAKCNVLATENDKLKGTVNELETQVDRLSDVEKGLSKIAKESNTEVNRLVEIVKETGELQAKIKKSLERQVMQQIVDAVVSSDRDGNFHLTTQETEMLRMRLKNLEGVKLNQDNFNHMIASDQNELTVMDVMKIVRNLLDDSVAEKDNIFVLDPNSVTHKSQSRSLFGW